MMEEIKEVKEEVKSADSLIDKAEIAAKRIEEANKRSEELLAKHEQLLSREVLSGKSQAGVPTPVITKDEEIRNRVNEMLKGTGLKI